MRDTSTAYAQAYQQWRTTSPGRLYRANDLIEDDLATQGSSVAAGTATTNSTDALYRQFLLFKADNSRHAVLNTADQQLLNAILTTCTDAIGPWQADAYHYWLKAGGDIMAFTDCEDLNQGANKAVTNSRAALTSVRVVQTGAEVTLLPEKPFAPENVYTAEWVDVLGRKTTQTYQAGQTLPKPKVQGVYVLNIYANSTLYAVEKLWVD